MVVFWGFFLYIICINNNNNNDNNYFCLNKWWIIFWNIYNTWEYDKKNTTNTHLNIEMYQSYTISGQF